MLDKITKAVSCAMIPCLDKDFVPATLWDREFRKAVNASGKSKDIVIAVERNPESVSIYPTVVFDNADASELAANVRHVERLVKGLLWMRGGWKVTIAGDAKIAEELAKIYSPEGERSFDYAMMGRIYSNRMQIVSCAYADAPKAKEPSMPLGRHLDGCRIGFDLGGSDRKCAATIDGKLVFSEEVPWDPYFEKDPQYHRDGINDTLKRAAAHLPRVDAIGGSSAGVYVNNRVRLASLFRGVPEDQFETKVKDLFIELGKEWGVPFEVVNDGEVTALAGSMEMNANCVLGISMGTSVAGGYVNREGNITDWLNELAFVPVDYREGAPADEWSGDLGCAVQYFCQQGVARLVPLAGIELPKDMKFAEQLKEVQKLMEAGDERAAKIYESIGVCFGYTIARYCEFYDMEKLLILGRVTTGKAVTLSSRKRRKCSKPSSRNSPARSSSEFRMKKDAATDRLSQRQVFPSSEVRKRSFFYETCTAGARRRNGKPLRRTQAN